MNREHKCKTPHLYEDDIKELFVVALSKLMKNRERRLYQADNLSAFLFALKELDTLNLKFTLTLWHTTVDKVTVNLYGSEVFHFKNGSEITV